MTVRLDQLPPATRARVVRDGTPIAAPRPRRPRRNVAGLGGSWRCHTCGVTHDRYAPAERHARDAGHPRIEVVI